MHIFKWNNLIVLRHIIGCNQNMPTKVSERSESYDTFGTNELKVGATNTASTAMAVPVL